VFYKMAVCSGPVVGVLDCQQRGRGSNK